MRPEVGIMTPQLKTALVRALIGGTICMGVTFFSAVAADGAGPAAIAAGGAFFAYLSARGAAEGFYDQGRDQKGDVRASDVGACAQPAELLASEHRASTP
jgi:hypothetical protein